MTEKSLFWSGLGVGDALHAPYGEEEWTEAWGTLFGSGYNKKVGHGVVRNYLFELLAVATSGSAVSVGPGAALVYGQFYSSDGFGVFPCEIPTTATRFDRIVLRRSWTGTSSSTEMTHLVGTEGAGVPPALQRVPGDTWDVAICSMSVTTGGWVEVTDERKFAPYWTRTSQVLVSACGVASGGTIDVPRYPRGGVWMPSDARSYAAGFWTPPTGLVGDVRVWMLVLTQTAGTVYVHNTARYGGVDEAYNAHEHTTAVSVELEADVRTAIAELTLPYLERSSTPGGTGDWLALYADRRGHVGRGYDTAGPTFFMGWLIEYTEEVL